MELEVTHAIVRLFDDWRRVGRAVHREVHHVKELLVAIIPRIGIRHSVDEFCVRPCLEKLFVDEVEGLIHGTVKASEGIKRWVFVRFKQVGAPRRAQVRVVATPQCVEAEHL